MNNNSYQIQILVNGQRCKQYQHAGRTYVEAKNGSEYVIEIKNNTSKRILALSSVDGLSAMTGETATDNDSGYIIDAYHSEKIKGFRFSDDSWAMFKFGYKLKGKTYAQSKEDGSEMNCGVIGMLLYNELEKPVVASPVIIREPYIIKEYVYPQNPYPWYPTWITTSGNSSGLNGLSGNITYACNSGGETDGACLNQNVSNCSVNFCQVDEASLKGVNAPDSGILRSAELNFDMGTEWGRAEESRVYTVSFDKGPQVLSLDIYYASRESLIEMGVPLTNKLKTNFPQSFQNRFAKPPRGWSGH